MLALSNNFMLTELKNRSIQNKPTQRNWHHIYITLRKSPPKQENIYIKLKLHKLLNKIKISFSLWNLDKNLSSLPLYLHTFFQGNFYLLPLIFSVAFWAITCCASVSQLDSLILWINLFAFPLWHIKLTDKIRIN